MHVGLIVPSFSNDEDWRIPALASLAVALAPHARLTVFPLRNPDGPRRSRLNGATVIHPGSHTLRFRSLARRVLSAIHEEHRHTPFDLLHGYWLTEPGLIAIAAGKFIGVPVVTSIGGAELAMLPGIGYGGMSSIRARATHRAIIERSTLVTGGSSYVLDLARRAVPASATRLRLAPLPVSLPAAAPAGHRSGEGPRLLQVGAYLPVKGQDIAVRAMPRIVSAHPDTKLTIIGENPRGYRQRMEALARGIGVPDAVELRERIPHDELRRWYAGADLLLMPSRHESQGMVVLEAASQGLPALGSDVGVVRDLAPDAAVAVQPDDAEMLALTAIGLLDDPGRRSSIGAAARERIAADYEIGPAGDAWAKIYHEALHPASRR